MKLTTAMEGFVLHWGEMGARWGVNRTVAQIHALLYLSESALPAEEIASTLSVARSNVSTSLRELQGWGLVKVVHVLGDRRHHFETLTDVWEMFQIILRERKRREVDPTLEFLREAVATSAGSTDEYARERLTAMLAFFEDAAEAHEQLQRPQAKAAMKAIRARGRFRAWLGSLGGRGAS